MKHFCRRYLELELKLASSDISPREIASFGSEYSKLSHIIKLDEERLSMLKSIAEMQVILKEESLKGPDGEEMVALVKAELRESEEALNEINNKILDSLLPRDDADKGGVVIEVRAGTGSKNYSRYINYVNLVINSIASFLLRWR